MQPENQKSDDINDKIVEPLMPTPGSRNGSGIESTEQDNKATKIGTKFKISIGHFALGISVPVIVFGVMTMTGTSWDIVLNMPTNLFILNVTLIIITSILGIIYFGKTNKPGLQHLSWGILIGLIIGVLCVIGFTIIMVTVIGRSMS